MRHNRTTSVIVLKTGDGVQPRPWVRIPPPPLTAPQTPWLSRLGAMATRRRSDANGRAHSQFAQPGHGWTIARLSPNLGRIASMSRQQAEAKRTRVRPKFTWFGLIRWVRWGR